MRHKLFSYWTFYIISSQSPYQKITFGNDYWKMFGNGLNKILYVILRKKNRSLVMWTRLYFFKVDKAQYERNLFSGTSDDSYLNILKRFTNWNLKIEILKPSGAKILLSENKFTLLATESMSVTYQHPSPTSMWTTDEFYCWNGS